MRRTTRLSRLMLLPSLAATLLLSAPAMAQTYGGCGFDRATLRFAGTVEQTAKCLLQKVRTRGSGSDAQEVPAWLLDRLAQPMGLTEQQIRSYLQGENIAPADLSASLTAGDMGTVRYFVIHDTSSPEIQWPETEFPENIDSASYSGNRLPGWANLEGRVNLIINRVGQSRLIVDWGGARSKAATKIEMNVRAPASRPLFVHVENIQPRIKPQGSWAWKAPEPGLSDAQEKRLALAYVVASHRAGRWLIPAYHFNIDKGLPDGHDDPQNMKLQSWVQKIQAIDSAIRGVRVE
jgi:hypothetical protein